MSFIWKALDIYTLPFTQDSFRSPPLISWTFFSHGFLKYSSWGPPPLSDDDLFLFPPLPIVSYSPLFSKRLWRSIRPVLGFSRLSETAFLTPSSFTLSNSPSMSYVGVKGQ